MSRQKCSAGVHPVERFSSECIRNHRDVFAAEKMAKRDGHAESRTRRSTTGRFGETHLAHHNVFQIAWDLFST